MRLDPVQPDFDDEAMRNRLARLADWEPDTRSLEARLESAMLDDAVDETSSYRFPTRRWLMGGVAAVLLVGLSITLLTGRPAQAARTLSVAELIGAHEAALVDHTDHLNTVSTIVEANQVLKQQWPQSPTLPAVDGGEVFACCVHKFGDRPAACLHLQLDGEPVSVVAADIARLAPPNEATPVISAGQGHWRVYRREPYTVVAGTIENRCVCVIGRHSAERLLALAESIRFDRP